MCAGGARMRHSMIDERSGRFARDRRQDLTPAVGRWPARTVTRQAACAEFSLAW
jgi:hypothetical protein